MPNVRDLFPEDKRSDIERANEMKRELELRGIDQDALRRLAPKFTLPDEVARALKVASSIPEFKIPELKPIQPIQWDNVNAYQSAGRLIARLEERYKAWQASIEASDLQVVIWALVDGIMIRVESLTEESFNGIAIEGQIENNGRCLLVTHQANLKLLCLVEQVVEETERRLIGFNVASRTTLPDQA